MVDAWWANDALWPIPLLLPLVLAGPLTPLLVWYVIRGRHRAGVLFTWTALTVVYGLAGAVGVIRPTDRTAGIRLGRPVLPRTVRCIGIGIDIAPYAQNVCAYRASEKRRT